jgi:hypothetical protein
MNTFHHRWTARFASLLPFLALLFLAPFATLAAEPLKLAMSSSTLAGISDKAAEAHIKPMLDVLARQTSIPIELSIHDCSTPASLMALGKDLNAGELHLGVMWGLEYGWLRDRHPDLAPLVVCGVPNDKDGMPIQLFVRKGFTGKLADLKGKRLATYPRMPLMYQAWLASLTREQGAAPDKFFGEAKEFPTPKEAIIAVYKEEFDCVVIGASLYRRYLANTPKLELAPLLSSAAFPEVALVGKTAAVDKLRAGLWSDLQTGFLEIHKAEEGRQVLGYFRVETFAKPDDPFRDLVRLRVREFPLSDLDRQKKP